MGAPVELVDWKRKNIEMLRAMEFPSSPVRDVTAIAYHYRRSPEELDESFWITEFAFLQTFKTQGVLPSVLVVNQPTKRTMAFCDKYSVELQVAKNLVPGKDIRSLCIDLVENLHSRFKTQYILTIQDDGFPMRPGLGEFVGKWDYVGAPWVHHTTFFDVYPYKYCVGNGGFSLRSKRICEIASKIYKKWFAHVPYWWYLVGDDTFYCKTLRFWFRKAVQGIIWPTPEQAADFSIESNKELLTGGPPLGFHAKGFVEYVSRFSKGGGVANLSLSN